MAKTIIQIKGYTSEKAANSWLRANPDVRIIDIKTTMAMCDDGYVEYGYDIIYECPEDYVPVLPEQKQQ